MNIRPNKSAIAAARGASARRACVRHLSKNAPRAGARGALTAAVAAAEMYDETGPDGKRRYTAQIATEFGVTRPTIYRHIECLASA